MISKFAYDEYGQFIFVDSPQFDRESKIYYANIRSKLPVFIHDDRTPAHYKVRVLKIDSLGKIYLNKDLELIPNLTTRREECYRNLENILKLWRARTEHIVVQCSSDQLVKIEDFRNHFSQIELIVDHLLEFGEIKNTEISKYMPSKDKAKLIRYLSLLEGLDIVRRTETSYKMGNEFINLEKRLEVKEDIQLDIRLVVLSHVIKNRYLTLKDVFGLNILEKTVNIDNVIYLPELELEEPIYRKRSTIANSYKYYYKRNINALHLTRILKRLENCGAIHRISDKYLGHDHLREKMLDKKRVLKPLTITQF